MAKNKNPMTEKHKCCICGCTFYGWGNNPWGALDKDGNVIEWKENDICCDECDSFYVLSGRLHLYAKARKEEKDHEKS